MCGSFQLLMIETGTGAVGALAAVCVGMLFHQQRRQSQKREHDSALLAKMRRLPLKITEHAACRMGCR